MLKFINSYLKNTKTITTEIVLNEDVSSITNSYIDRLEMRMLNLGATKKDCFWFAGSFDIFIQQYSYGKDKFDIYYDFFSGVSLRGERLCIENISAHLFNTPHPSPLPQGERGSGKVNPLQYPSPLVGEGKGEGYLT